MAFVHGKNNRLLFNQYNISSYLNETSIAGSADVHETTTFGKDSKTYAPGQKDGTLSASGLFDGDANAIEDIFTAALGNTTLPVMTIFPSGFGVGNRVKLLQANETSYEISSPVSDMTAISAEFQASDGIDHALCLLSPAAAVSATGNGVSQDNTAASSNGGVAHLHVLAAAGTSPSLTGKVQHSVDNSTWVDLITFAAKTAVGVERKEVTGTVNRYVRAQYTIGGTGGPSFTAAIGFARR